MNKNPLARALSLAATGSVLVSGGLLVTPAAHATSPSGATTMYNTFTTSVITATDGWTRTFDGSDVDTVATGPESQGNKGDIVPWVGIGGSSTPTASLPLGYGGSQHLNWVVDFNGVGANAEISTADAQARYQFAAEIDTGGGAWNDGGRDANGNITETPTGWKHQTDIGIIRSDTDMIVTLKPSTLGTLQNPTFSRFGITVFTGMDTTTANYGHHGGWNCPTCATPSLYTKSNPFYGAGVGSGLDYLIHSDNVDAATGLTFVALAGQAYSVFLGGVGFANWNAGVDQYKLAIETSPVPVPAAVWLFGSALAGMGVIGRRRSKPQA